MTVHSRNLGLRSRELQPFIERVETIPTDATVKGMYVETFLQTLDREGLERPTAKRFTAFKDYPLRDYMTMLLEACPKLHPEESIAEALKLQGRLVYPTLISSTVGKVLFSLAGRSWHAALPLAARAYEISLKPGSATAQRIDKKSALVALREVYNFAECFHVGIMEGAMEVFLVEGTVVPRKLSRSCDVDLQIQWY